MSSNYNYEFEDTMDTINNIAKGYGYRNGIHWADSMRKRGLLDYGTYKKFENAHNLRIRYSHGNARDISISYETLLITKRWERMIENSRARKERKEGGIHLPPGTYRAFTKDFHWKGIGGRVYDFRFEIVHEHQQRAYDDGTRFSGYGYSIYVKDAPWKEWCIDHNIEYEFHFYDIPRWNPSICWNSLITDFQDANAVMITWVKRYCRILDQLLSTGKFNSSTINKGRRRHTLPSGTFRSKKRRGNKVKKTIHIAKEAYDQILEILGKKKPELGGMLGWKDDQTYIEYFVFDKNAVVGNAEYNPDTKYLSEVLNNWDEQGIYLGGFVHSHPTDCKRLSQADVEYARRIMKEFELNYLFMPIITSSYQYKTTFNPYLVYANGRVVECKLVIDDKASSKEDDSAIIDEDLKKRIEAIEAGFDSMKGVKTMANIDPLSQDDTFARISNVLDISYMSECSVIGIGCGGARSFYESMARMGVGNFYLMDGDKATRSNIASQNGYISEIGMFKPELIKRRLLDINENVNVVSFNDMLNDEMDDNYLEENILNKVDLKKTVICAFTDNFFAQSRISRIALKYGIPFISGQHHARGTTSEVVFWYPGITKYSLREIAKSRYEAFENGYVNEVTSVGSPIFNTTRLNALCEKIAIGLLLYHGHENHAYCTFLKKMGDKNLILIKQKSIDESNPFYDLFVNDTDSFFDEVVWVHPESLEDLSDVVLEEGTVEDTRAIFKRVSESKYMP